MHITDIMRGDSPTFSFEFFPPKTPEAAEMLYQTIRDLESYMPHFVSVTYGAGGSTRDLTHDLVERIKTTTKLDPIPHLTCVCHNEEEIEAILLRYAKSAIGNILALGGDRPRGNRLRQIARLVPTRDRPGEVHSPIQRIRRASGSPRFRDRRGRFSRRPSRDAKSIGRNGSPQSESRCRRRLHRHPAIFRQSRLPRFPRTLRAGRTSIFPSSPASCRSLR